MKNIFRKFIFILIFLYTYTINAGWYPRIENKTRVSECVYWNETLDTSWENLNKIFGYCQWGVKDGWVVYGSHFTCDNDNNQFIFRTKDNCETYKDSVNNQKKHRLEDYATKGVKNKTEWVVAYNSCFVGADKDSIIKIGLQKTTDYCVCLADQVSNYSERELEQKGKERVANLLVSVIETCSRKIGYTLTTTQISAAKAALIPKSGR